jgi:hypothetical protein
MLFFRRAVTDALESATSIREPRLVLIGPCFVRSLFVLSGRSAGLADVYK